MLSHLKNLLIKTLFLKLENVTLASKTFKTKVCPPKILKTAY